MAKFGPNAAPPSPEVAQYVFMFFGSKPLINIFEDCETSLYHFVDGFYPHLKQHVFHQYTSRLATHNATELFIILFSQKI